MEFQIKKFLSLLLAIAITASTGSVAFATNSNAGGEETFDLSTITEPVQVIFEDTEVLPDGTVIITTTTATKPKMTKIGNEFSTVISTAHFEADGETQALVTLTTDFWYNRVDKVVGWSDATVDLWTPTGDGLTATDPYGTTDDPFIGLPWVKVASDWDFESYFPGHGVSGTVWNKINSDGKITRS